MEMLYLFLVIVTIVSLVSGSYKVRRLDIAVELNALNSPYFYLGLSFNEYYTSDYKEQEFIIGLFFINFSFIFYKDLEEIDG